MKLIVNFVQISDDELLTGFVFARLCEHLNVILYFMRKRATLSLFSMMVMIKETYRPELLLPCSRQQGLPCMSIEIETKLPIQQLESCVDKFLLCFSLKRLCET
jgi:hypothetical protein